MLPGDSDIDRIVALPFGDHFHDIRYQKHFLRARYPPVELSFFSKSCAILEVLLRRQLKRVLVWDGFCGCVVQSFVVIWEVLSTKALPSLFMSRFVGVLRMRLSYLSDTDHRMVSRRVFQMLDALPLPWPTPRILCRRVDWYVVCAIP